MTAAVSKLDATLTTIRARRAQIDPLKVGLILLIALPVALGWMARKVCLVVWVIATFLWVAAQQGWKAGSPKDPEGEGSP